jgi:hypothetical protein
VSDHPTPPWLGLAAKALTAARDRDLDVAGKALNAIQLRFGGEVIPAVMLAWIDTMATACGFNPKPGQAVGVLWQFDGSDEITDADATPPAARWAGRLVAARLADDQPQFRALINSCGTDEVFSANVAALLTTCGVMLRRAGGESL